MHMKRICKVQNNKKSLSVGMDRIYKSVRLHKSNMLWTNFSNLQMVEHIDAVVLCSKGIYQVGRVKPPGHVPFDGNHSQA